MLLVAHMNFQAAYHAVGGAAKHVVSFKAHNVLFKWSQYSKWREISWDNVDQMVTGNNPGKHGLNHDIQLEM